MRIFIGGYYGFGNAGDELILKYLSEFFKKKYGAVLFALSHDTDYSHKLIETVEFIERNDFKKITEILSISDLTVLGGGGLFQDYDTLEPAALFAHPEYGVQSYANLPILSKIYKKPIAYLFQGVGPFFSVNAKRFARYAFSLADYISVRDEASYKLLSDMGYKDVVLSADPVFLSNPAIGTRNAGMARKKIGISLRRWAFGNVEENCINIMAAFLKDIIKENDIYFFSFQDFDEYNNDSYIYYRISKILNDDARFKLIRFNDCSMDKFEESIASMNFFVGMRYHSIVLSAKHHIPFVALSYWNKVYELTKELSLEEYCVDIYNRFSLEILKNAFEKLRCDEKTVKKRIELGMNKIKNKIDVGIESLEFFLERWIVK